MSKTQEYYDMHQRNVDTFRKFPNAEAIKEGIDSATNARACFKWLRTIKE